MGWLLVSGLLMLQATVWGSAVLTRTTNAGSSAKVRRRGPPPLTATVTFAPSFKAAYRARGSAPLTATTGPLLHEYVVSAGTPRHELSAMLHGLSGSGQVETASQLLQHALEVEAAADPISPDPNPNPDRRLALTLTPTLTRWRPPPTRGWPASCSTAAPTWAAWTCARR